MNLINSIILLIMATRIKADSPPAGLLYPRESETREIKSLDGIWNFRLSSADPRSGFDQKFFSNDLSQTGQVIPMPVPSSYNDITQNPKIRDHVGLVWYDRKFFVSDLWQLGDKRVFLRFSSVMYAAQVWVNGQLVMNHDIGHLPFERDITSVLKFGAENRVTVACDNMLRPDTVPQGYTSTIDTEDGKKLIQGYTFDFFNYAGIHRPVVLYTTPQIYVADIDVLTNITGTTGIVTYDITPGGLTNDTEEILCRVVLKDRAGNPVAKDDGSGSFNGTLRVPLARFWWPYLMDPDPGYMYTLEVTLISCCDGTDNTVDDKLDVYRLPIGIRTLKWTNSSFLINGKPMYLHGLGRHEDSDIRGKGLDLALIAKDYNLIRWVGANCYRTSHYPYADEIMDMADKNGIMIIDECPSVDTDGFSNALLKKHKDSLTELIRRDKNRPSVIAWSIANEPRTQTTAAGTYFGDVVKHVKSIDKTRPVTIAIARGYFEDKAGQYLDIISFNRYNAWYSNPGQLGTITQQVIQEAKAWRDKYNKPVLMSEYGADTYEGLHILPEYVWTEEYQVELMSQHFKAFDQLRAAGWFIGEFIWNFADFKTAQTYTRVGGNKKGIFTRNREPKAGAIHLRRRYMRLAKELYNAPLPTDLRPYEVQNFLKNGTNTCNY